MVSLDAYKYCIEHLKVVSVDEHLRFAKRIRESEREWQLAQELVELIEDIFEVQQKKSGIRLYDSSKIADCLHMYTVREASHEEEVEDGFQLQRTTKKIAPTASSHQPKSPRSLSKKSAPRHLERKAAGTANQPFITKTIQSVLNQAVVDVAHSIDRPAKAKPAAPLKNNYVQVLADFYSQRDNKSSATIDDSTPLAPRHQTAEVCANHDLDRQERSDTASDDAVEREIEQLLSDNRSKTPSHINLESKQSSNVSQIATKSRTNNNRDRCLPSESLGHRGLRRNTDVLLEKQSLSVTRPIGSRKKSKRLKPRPTGPAGFAPKTNSSNHSNLKAMRRDNRGTLSLKVEISNININNITHSALHNRQLADCTLDSPSQGQTKRNFTKSSIFFRDVRANNSTATQQVGEKHAPNRKNRFKLHLRKGTANMNDCSSRSEEERSAELLTPSPDLRLPDFSQQTPRTIQQSSELGTSSKQSTPLQDFRPAKPSDLHIKLFSDKPRVAPPQSKRINLEQILKKPSLKSGSLTARTAKPRLLSDIFVSPGIFGRSTAAVLTDRTHSSRQPQEESSFVGDSPQLAGDDSATPALPERAPRATSAQRGRKKFDLKGLLQKLQIQKLTAKEPSQLAEQQQ